MRVYFSGYMDVNVRNAETALQVVEEELTITAPTVHLIGVGVIPSLTAEYIRGLCAELCPKIADPFPVVSP